MRNVVALVVCSREAIVIFSRQVYDLEILRGEERRGFEEKLVDPARPLASSCDEQRGAGGIEVENFQRFLARDRVAEIFSDWCACDDTGGAAEIRAAVLESEKNTRSKFRGETVGASCDGIRFVNETREPCQASREDRRGGCEAPHAKHDGGAVFSVNRTTVAIALPKSLQETKKRRRDNHRGHSDRREFFGAEFGVGLECRGVDFFFRNKKQNLVSPLVERLGNSKAGEEMSSRSPASDNGLEWFHTRGSKCGRRSTGAKRETSGCPWRWILTRRPIKKRHTTRFDPP